MLKILQARLQRYVNHELLDVQTSFRKGRRNRDHSVVFETASKYCISDSFVDYDGYSINRELSDVQAGFRKGRGTRDQIANIWWIMEKARKFQKKRLFLLY